MTAPRPIRWGVAGFGWVARDYMAGAIREAGHRLIAVGDPDPDARADAARLGARGLPSVEALAADGEVDAIYVATPNHLHRPAVEAAARAGKPVLCEKPMAATLADATAMVAACETAGVLYGTAFDQRHHPAHRAMREAIRGGRLGTVTGLRILYACWLPPAWTAGRGTENWRVIGAKAGGGALIDLAPHGVDLAGFLLDEPLIDLHALMQRRVHPYAVDDGGMLVGRTRGGVLASLHVAFNHPDALPRRRLEVTGTAGVLTATNTMGQDPGGTLTFTDAATGADTPLFFAGTSPFEAQVRRFGDAIRTGASDEFSGSRDLHTMRLLADACAAADAAPPDPRDP